jgi:hypothetical protein
MLEVSEEHLLVFDRISSDTELCSFATGSSQLTLSCALMMHMGFMDQRRVGGHAPRPPADAGVAAAASVLSFVYNEGITDFIDTIAIVLKATGLEVDGLEKITARCTALFKEAPNRQPVAGAALHDLNSSLVQIGAQTKSWVEIHGVSHSETKLSVFKLTSPALEALMEGMKKSGNYTPSNILRFTQRTGLPEEAAEVMAGATVAVAVATAMEALAITVVTRATTAKVAAATLGVTTAMDLEAEATAVPQAAAPAAAAGATVQRATVILAGKVSLAVL